MECMSRWISFSKELIAAPDVVVGDTRLRLRARVLTVRLPFGAVVWNRPLAVQVRRKDQVSTFAMNGRRTKCD